MYKVIDEKLNLKSCSVKDLTMNQIIQFLQQWNDESTISTLSVFL